MPFLGPAIAVWILLAIAGMGYYFVFIVRNGHTGSPHEPSRRTESPRWGEPPAPVMPGYLATSYDMEAYPDDSWRQPTG